MIPVTLFLNAEVMYKELAELVVNRPECKRYDDGEWRIIELLENGQAVFILMEYCPIDVWEESERWLTIASDGEHPNGYGSFEEAVQALETEKDNLYWQAPFVTKRTKFHLSSSNKIGERGEPDNNLFDCNCWECTEGMRELIDE